MKKTTDFLFTSLSSKIKVFKNKTVDELLDCNFDTPGIPLTADIKEVVIGDKLISNLITKYKIKTT